MHQCQQLHQLAALAATATAKPAAQQNKFVDKTARVCNKQGCVELVFGATYFAAHKLNGWHTSTWKRPPG
jgi:hypothetical protein